MSDAESDEDLRRAIALSLMSPEPQNDVILIDDSDEQDDDDLDKPRSTRPNANQTPRPLPEKTHMTAIDLSTPIQLLSGTQREATPVAAGLLGLNRWEMETERLARAALRRKRDEDASMSSGPAQKRRASKSPVPSQDCTRQVKGGLANVPKPLLRRNAKTVLSGPLDPNSAFIEDRIPNHLPRSKKTSETRQTSLQEPSTSPADTSPEIPCVTEPRQHLSIKAQAEALNLSGIQYPDGTVKKTWAFGYDRKGDDIKIEEVLQSSDLELAVLSSFQIDADWVTSKLDVKTKVVWVLQAKDEAQNWASGAPKHFRFCFPAMDGNINCMHSKLMLLAHKTHLRVVIPSANLTPYDWGETGCLENICFLIDLPRLSDGQETDLKKLTPFGEELLHFLRAMGLDKPQIESMRRFDFSRTAHLAFVHSIGGSHHVGTQMSTTGLCGLGKAIRDLGLNTEDELNIDFLAASIGHINENFLKSMYLAAQGDDGLTEYEWRTHKPPKKKGLDSEVELRVADGVRSRCRIYFPLRETVQMSKGGVDGAGTICFQPKYWNSSTFPRALMRDCKSQRKGLLMHSKMIFVRSERANLRGHVAWAYVGSHNLSESAWGRLVKDNTTKKAKINIRNWECGVVIPVPPFTPPAETLKDAGAGVADGLDMSVFDGYIPVPMVIPGEEYQGRRPWFYSEQQGN